ncbi:MAG: sigma-70 family RNA polymerase sigma factor [Clostridia bacterium]|nr:sigma-70 family RNA polymerase sigma factor [Clostridia bacterium]
MDEDHKRKLEEVYRENYKTYLSYAKRKLMAYTGSVDGAEDLVHQAFLKAVENDDQIQDHLEKWLMVTLKNIIMNHFSKYNTRVKKMKEIQPIESEPSFSDEIDDLETLKQELKDKDYEIVYLFAVKKKTVDEISEKIGLTPGNIYVRLYRIRKKIENVLFLLLVVIISLPR